MMPDKIYSNGNGTFSTMPVFDESDRVEYIRKDFHDKTIEAAEEHAYFAGHEKLREKLLEWAKEKYDKAFRLHLKKGDRYHYGLGKMDAYRILIDKLNKL